MAKDYGQYCPVARALDLVGERWSLLIARELAHGPQRYSDLLERLPGCGTNILAARLRHLEAGGVLTRRRLPPPASSTVYELTPYGAALRPVLRELALWGARALGPPGADVVFPPGWLAQVLDTVGAWGWPEGRLLFRMDDDVAGVADGTIVPEALEAPDVVVSGDARGFYHLFVDGSDEGVRIEGDASVLERALEVAAARRAVSA